MNILIKIVIAGVFLIGAFFCLRYFLDFASLEGRGRVQEREFKKVVALVESTEGINEHRVFRGKWSDGTPSSSIEGFFSTNEGVLLHAGFTRYLDQKASKSICLDWTVNGMGIYCEKDQKRIHPCNAGPAVLQEYRFHTFDVETMIEKQLSVLQKLEDIQSSTSVNIGGVICRRVSKIDSETLATALTCSDSDAFCEGSSKK